MYIEAADIHGDDQDQDMDELESSELIGEPRMFVGQLKEYQKKGVTWLVNLYEQGINGILAGISIKMFPFLIS